MQNISETKDEPLARHAQTQLFTGGGNFQNTNG